MGLKDWTKKLFPNDYDVDEYPEDDYSNEVEEPVREDIRPRDTRPYSPAIRRPRRTAYSLLPVPHPLK